ncbi:hypothetical protein [Glycomyces buryatensis]|uniref:Integral membrane protein n=1 Tax=Glycomyces buryatensis TaxID=2570927 RepID=A0A4S8QE03_9ACTN|nr:hypothetical protein [Glycomyces buryatensis]THV42803.1 hypothetical protein FAB82_04615 [Glycomyces buryatensis]
MDVDPLSDGERAELERLRAERAAAKDGARVPGRRGARWAGSTLVMSLAALLALVSAVVVFARDEVLDTDRYVQTVAPLAEHPDVREAIETRLSTTINEKMDLRALTTEAIDSIQVRSDADALARLDLLAAPIASAVEGFVGDQVHTVVYSDRFAQLWENANETAHRGIAAILRGTETETLALDGDMLYIELGPVIEEVKSLLVARGLTIAERMPEFSVQFPLMEIRGLANAQGMASLLSTLAWVLPLAALALLAVGVYIAPNRRRALVIGSLLFGVAMVVLIVAVAVGRAVTLSNLPETVHSPQAVAAVYDIMVRFLTASAQTMLVLALLVAIAAWLAGPGAFASALRGGLTQLRDAAASGLSRSGLQLGPAARFAARNRRPLEAAAAALGLLWLILWSHRGMEGTLWVAATVALAVIVIEVLGRVETVEPVEAEPHGA